jgi:hypothetical protein
MQGYQTRRMPMRVIYERMKLSPESKFENAMGNIHRRSTKYRNYFALYDLIVADIPENPCVMEIGIANGGSLETWRQLFPVPSRIIGVDLNQRVSELRKDGFEVYILDTGKSEEWSVLTNELSGKVDLLVDDGGHTNLQQIQAVIHGVNLVKPGGWIVIEDLHASAMNEFGNPSRFSAGNFLNELNMDMHRIHQRSNESPKYPSISNRIDMIIQSCSWAALRVCEPKTAEDHIEVSYGDDVSLMDFDHRWDSLAVPQKLKKVIPKPIKKAARKITLFYADIVSIRPLLKKL